MVWDSMILYTRALNNSDGMRPYKVTSLLSLEVFKQRVDHHNLQWVGDQIRSSS